MRIKIWTQLPVLINLCAVSDGLVTPNIPARSTANLPSEAFFDANTKVILVVFHAWILGYVLFNVLGGRDLVVDLVIVI